MGKTSSEVKQRWKDKTYKRFTLYLRKEEDQAYLNYIERRRENGDSLADIMREGLDCLIAEENRR